MTGVYVKLCWVTLPSCHTLVGMAWSCPATMKDMAEIPEIMRCSGWDGIVMEGVNHVIIQFCSTFVPSYSLYSQYPAKTKKVSLWDGFRTVPNGSVV